MGRRLHHFIWISALTCAVGVFLFAFFAEAVTAEELQSQIDSHNEQIAALESEIAQYQTELNETSAQKQTLQSTLNQLDLSRKKINASISVAQNQIDATELEIRQLGGDIKDKESLIDSGQAGLAESIRRLHELDSISMALLILQSGSLSQFWDAANTLTDFQGNVNSEIHTLQDVKTDLVETKEASERKQAELVAHRNELKTQQRALDVNRQQQAELLAETKNKESNYQQIIADKQAAKEQFAAEIADLESELKYTLDPSTLPTSGSAILAWPLKNVRITQYFGNTEFAASGAYNGKGHNGIDFAAAIGTPVYASLSGTVIGAGNTDVGGCYSYGKWIMIRHANGLSTLYAHLSSINVSEGESVGTRDVIGYSGFTGYATGPHLHYGVYVSNAVQIMNLGTWYKQNGRSATTACAKAGVTIPVAPLNAYLNPMNYLPEL